MTGILALPFYLPALLLNKIPDLNSMKNIYKILVLGRITASIYAAASVALFYLILKEVEKLIPNIKENKYYEYIFWVFLVLYAFGSGTYTISSRSLWQHTTGQFILSLSILLLLYSLKKPKLIMWQGLLMGILVLIRFTNIVVAIPIAFYVFLKYRKEFLKFVALTIPAVLFLAIYNYKLFGSIFVEGYQLGDTIEFSTPFFLGATGLLLSPGKGLLFSTPVFLLGFYEIFKNIIKKNKLNWDHLLITLGISFLFGFILSSKWRAWDGADSFGPRLLTDLLPIIALFSYFIVTKIKTRLLMILLVIFTIYSLYANINAVVFRKSRCTTVHNWTFYCLTPPKEIPEY
jgi:hypothetical protein